ncbi:hypothetical protein EG68_01711 [Paragonimus skrjabini miyazakii]|uniref:Uncharacterized protein n=1 Tax=Paragonimus skrjabini miyazakii TaxID=59628 RepID=A0A8S9ZBJ9_9TREM|nr:hypothetical protein EG68_01711 [Paragonimus skrjabini miyazakii]
MENGEDEEDEALEESIGEESLLGHVRTREAVKRPEGRAPTMTIEVVRVGRPLKVLSLIASLISLMLLIIGAVSTSWLHVNESRMGLFQNCENVKTEQRESSSPACHFVSTDAWVNWLCSLLVLSSLLLTILGLVLLTVGMLIIDLRRKSALYKTVIVLYSISCLLAVSAIIIFPTVTYYKLKQSNENNVRQKVLTVGWSYILITCSVPVLIAAIILLEVDKKGEEVIYREVICRASQKCADKP